VKPKHAGGRARRARQELLWGVTGFLLVQLALAVYLETGQFRLHDEEFQAKFERLEKQIEADPDRPLVVVLGSSRTHMGLDAGRLNRDPEQRGRTFNLGFEGCGPMMHRVTLRRLGKADIRPALVIVEVVPAQLLVGASGPIEERWLDGARFRADELALLLPYFSRPWSLAGGWARARLLPCTQHQTELRNWLAVDRKPDNCPVDDWTQELDPSGWRALSVPPPEKVPAATERVLNEYRRELSDGHFHPSPVQALRDLLDDCRNQGTPAAVLLMPEASRFRALYPAGFEPQLAELLESLQREHGLRAVIDARAWVGDDGFVDGHHLQVEGARVFTERFGREAVRPLLEATAGN
jgi:hypothetical protein